MRKGVLILLLPILALAQVNSVLAQSSVKPAYLYFNMYAQSTYIGSPATSDFLKFSQKLSERSEDKKSEKQFLRYVFTKTHQRYLKEFDVNANFHQLSETGTYNCLTGTALYALLLKDLGYDYRIIETNYHIFLVVNTSEGKILFEATDPANGFVADADLVEKKLDHYKINQAVENQPGKNFYLYSFKLFHEVSLDQMLGLLYYNEAIEAFNERDLHTAITNLDKAIALYNSPRVHEFSKIILLSVMQSEMEATVKENCVKKIQSIRKQKMPAIASSAVYKP